MPDNYVQNPYDTQNFNRYGYVLNNPLSYTDITGEFIFAPILIGALIGAITGAVAYTVSAIITGNWNWGGFAMSVIGGAVSGAIGGAVFPGMVPQTITLGKMAVAQAAGFASSFLPGANISVGNWNFTISPSIAFGKGLGFGATASVGFSDGNFSTSVAYGASYQVKALGSEAKGWEYRKSWSANWDDGKNGFGLYSTTFSGLGGRFDQKVGGFSYRNGDFGLRYENDGRTILGKLTSGDTDMFRTNAFEVSYKELSLRGNLFTGKSGTDESATKFEDAILNPDLVDFNGRKHGYWKNSQADTYRLGALSFGYKGYRIGANSEHIRNVFQNVIAHNISPQPDFRMLSKNFSPYFQYQSHNRYTLW